MDKHRDVLRKNIKRYRKELNISQEELSERCGYSSTYIGKIERGDRSPSLDTLARLAESLEVPLSSLFDPVERRYIEYADLDDGDIYSSYDLMVRHFQYLVGKMETDGSLLYLRWLPWFSNPESNGSMEGRKLWNTERFECSARLQRALKNAVESASSGTVTHHNLSLSNRDHAQGIADCVVYPFDKSNPDPNHLGVEIFWPRLPEGKTSLQSESVRFDLTTEPGEPS
ncbi:MAG: helix-turn-helix domain-containing protein [bacterium]